MTDQSRIVWCAQDSQDPAVGFLEDYIPPEEADPSHPALAAGWHERSPLCRRHLDIHRQRLLDEGTPLERIREIQISEYIRRHPENNVKGEKEK